MAIQTLEDKAQKVWSPHLRQKEFLELPDSIFEGFFGGAAGPGKTETLMMFPIVRGWFRHPHFKGIILRRTFPDLEKEIVGRSHEYYPLTGGKYNEQKRRWRWPSGATLQFGHAEHEKDIRNYDSAEYNYIAFDELTHFTEFQYTYLAFTRARSSDSDLPAVVRSASNPGNIGHGWVRKRFIEPAREGRKILVETVKDITGAIKENKRIFIPASATDNPTLLKNDPGYLARMEMLPEAEKRAKVYGDWWLFSGQVFTEFRNEKLPNEPDNALHVIKPFRIPEWYPRIFHLDWGTSSAACGYWGAVTPDARVIVYREYYQKGRKVSDWANDFRELSAGESIRRVGLCHSAFANRGEEHTLAEQFAHFSGVEPYSSGRDRIGGKYLIHEFLRWKPLERSALSRETYDQDLADRLFRFYGESKYKDYLNMFKPPEMELNLPRLQIFETCPELIKTVPLCVRDEKNVEDVAEFEGDDPYDSLRGLLKMVDQFTSSSREEQERLVRFDGALNKLAQTGDQTAFYRHMEYLERGTSESFGVRRHSSIGRNKRMR
jgi:hypothetical protein